MVQWNAMNGRGPTTPDVYRDKNDQHGYLTIYKSWEDPLSTPPTPMLFLKYGWRYGEVFFEILVVGMIWLFFERYWLMGFQRIPGGHTTFRGIFNAWCSAHMNWWFLNHEQYNLSKYIWYYNLLLKFNIVFLRIYVLNFGVKILDITQLVSG